MIAGSNPTRSMNALSAFCYSQYRYKTHEGLIPYVRSPAKQYEKHVNCLAGNDTCTIQRRGLNICSAIILQKIYNF